MLQTGARLALLVLLSAPGAVAQSASPKPPVPPAAPVAPVPPVPPAAPSVGASAPAAPGAAEASRAARATPAGSARASEHGQGVARLERGGRTIAQGAVLRSDGRILTALSPLGHGNFIQARFADNSTLGVRVVASDRVWDLALLAPEGGHWTEGLRPSVLEPPRVTASLGRFRARGARLEPSSSALAARQTVLGRDGATLSDVLVLSGHFGEDELGSPLFDERGDVAAIVIQACAPASAKSCQLSAFGAPVSALKQFLKKAPPREPLPAAWIGLRGAAAHDGSVAGVRVVAIDPGGPAERAGLRGSSGQSEDGGPTGDLIVAVDDAPVATPEEMRDAINRLALGGAAEPKPGGGGSGAAQAVERAVRLLVFGSGKFREVLLPLRPPQPLPQPEAPAPAPSTAPAPNPQPAPVKG